MHREELMAELRLQGITDVREVARAFLETNGMVSVIRRKQEEAPGSPKPRATG